MINLLCDSCAVFEALVWLFNWV